MKISIAFLIAFALFPDPAWAQNPPAGSFINRTPAPATCQPGSVFQAGTGARTYYTCPAGTPVGIGASGGVTSVQTLTGAVALFTTNAKTSTYQVLAADFTACKTIPVASGTFTITLVASGAQPASGQCVKVINYGSGVVTIARSGQNINGGTASLTLAAASATAPTEAFIVSDGTNYFGSLASAGGCAASATQILVGATCAGDALFTWDSTAKSLTVGPSGAADDRFARFGYSGISNNGSVEVYAKNDNNNFTAALSIQADEDNSDGAGFVEGLNILARANNTAGNVSVAGAKVDVAGTSNMGATSSAVTVLQLSASGLTNTTTAIGLSVQNISGASASFSIKTGTGLVSLGDDLIFANDNTDDIGASAATRPRTGYFGTSVIAPTLSGGVATLTADVVNPFTIVKNTQSATAPGVNVCDVRFIAGTNGGTGKIVAACGTSATEVVIADNIGGGL